MIQPIRFSLAACSLIGLSWIAVGGCPRARLDDPHRPSTDRAFTEVWHSRAARSLAPQWVWLRTIADRSGILPVVGRILARGPYRSAVATIVPCTFQPDADIAPFAVLAVAWTSLPEARDHCSDVPAKGLDGARPVTVDFSPHLPRIEQP